MTSWVRDLALGARLAVAGGRDGWARLAMTAVGVGLGVALLLGAASIPAMLQARHDRTKARDVTQGLPAIAAARNTLLLATVDTEFRDRSIHGRLLQPDGNQAPVPPGLTRLPGPGQMVVSPALDRLLASSDGALLRPRLPYRIAGTITDDGLAGPNELAFYAGSDRLSERPGAIRIDRFGADRTTEPLSPVIVLLIVIAFVVLLLPVAVFIAAAVRFAGDRRDRRLAALRLVGADSRAVRRIAAGEALVGALVGLAAGAGLLLAGRQLVERFTVSQISIFAGDIRPDTALTVLIVLAVPVCTVGITLLAMRRIVVEPLGVVRRSTGVRRRLWWRLVLPAVGLLALYPLFGSLRASGGTFNEYQVAAGVTLLLLGVAAVLPWLIEAAVHRIGGGSVPWQLAIRRLQLNSASSARAVNGVAVAVAGTIALQTLFASVDQQFTQPTGQDPSRGLASVGVQDGQDAERFRQTPGVRAVLAVTQIPLANHPVQVGDCDTLREMARIDRCAGGDVFLVNTDVRPGQRMTPQWTVPARARRVQGGPNPVGVTFDGVLATPEAIPPALLRDSHTEVWLKADGARPDAIEHVRNTAATLDPPAPVLVFHSEERVGRFDTVRRGLFAGVLVTLLLIGASLLVSTVEQLRERQRLLAVLVAFGTRRTTLTWSVLYQVAVPMVLGLLLAMVTGAGLGAILLTIVNQPPALDWASIAGIIGAAAGVVLLVTALSMPALWRMMRPSGLRTE